MLICSAARTRAACRRGDLGHDGAEATVAGLAARASLGDSPRILGPCILLFVSAQLGGGGR